VGVQWYDNGPADSPFFRYTPYRQQVSVAASASTGGTRRALIGYDQPNISDSAWRVRAVAFFDEDKFQNYFGVGESTLEPLKFPGSTKEFEKLSD
jgi:hypothetical protein